jgi:hypothetical protein
MALSGHSNRNLGCLLPGVKRTLINGCSPILIYEHTA